MQQFGNRAVSLLRISALLLILGGFGLRLGLVDSYPFREDEAIYSYWALHLWRVDPLALTVWPDKPPLFLWLLGGVFRLWGVSEASARLLNIFASTLTIAVVAATARRLWGRSGALIAALLLALNPFAIGFAPTAYTDSMLVLWGSAAFYAAVCRRPFWSGLCLAAAVMTKQQGVLYAPLILALLWTDRWNVAAGGAVGTARLSCRRTGRADIAGAQISFLCGFALLVLPILGWDSLRWQVAPSPWDLSVRNYGGFALLPMSGWLPRLRQWNDLLWYLTGSWWVWSGIVLGGIWRMAAWMHSRLQAQKHSGRGEREWALPSQVGVPGVHVPQDRMSPQLHTSDHMQSVARCALLFWSLAFLVFHVVTSTQVWDRYLLPLAPVMALLVGWMGAQVLGLRGGNARRLAVVLLSCCLLVFPAVAAARGDLPIGGDHGDYAGLEVAVAWMNAHAPEGSVLYHRALGWHARFSFFDAEAPAQNRFDLRWYPSTVSLADNAAKAPHQRKYLIAPDWAPLQRAERDLSVRQLALVTQVQAGHFTVYEIFGLPKEFCSWCVCAPRLNQDKAWLK